MNIKDLKCFEAVYRACSISGAARKLFITPQGLSKVIQSLENELNTVLFTRTAQGVKPTETASFLYSRSGDIIQRFEEIEHGIYQLENRKTVLRIGYACGVFNLLPFELILNFTRCCPDITVEWCEYANEEVQEMLETSRLEYGFIVGAPRDEAVIWRKLAGSRVRLLVYEGHPLYDREIVHAGLLKNEKMILMNEHFHIYHDFMAACRNRGFIPQIGAKTADGTALYKLCRQHAGLAVIPEFMMEDFNLTHMRAIPFEEDLRWDVYGVYRKDNHSYETIRMFDRYLTGKSWKNKKSDSCL